MGPGRGTVNAHQPLDASTLPFWENSAALITIQSDHHRPLGWAVRGSSEGYPGRAAVSRQAELLRSIYCTRELTYGHL